MSPDQERASSVVDSGIVEVPESTERIDKMDRKVDYVPSTVMDSGTVEVPESNNKIAKMDRKVDYVPSTVLDSGIVEVLENRERMDKMNRKDKVDENTLVDSGIVEVPKSRERIDKIDRKVDHVPSTVVDSGTVEVLESSEGVHKINRKVAHVPSTVAKSNTVEVPESEEKIDKMDHKKKVDYVPRIKWLDLLVQIFIHGGCLYGFYLMLFQARILTSVWAFVTIYTSGFGITAGAHRLWSHRAYKAKWPLRLLLVFLFTITGQRHVYAWALDHRVHHKHSETDADPHNAKRGFFFAHVGWLFTTPHPDVVAKRQVIDMSDLEADPIVMWQKRLYIPLFALLVIGLPVAIPWYFWSEPLWISFWVNFNFRFCVTLNIAFFVNSVAHMWGQRPYDKNISPVENIAVSIAALGEGWHNYHHVFPWDYKTGELGNYSFNITTGFIDAFARIGWAYDRKYVSPEMVRRRATRSGDGSHVWGYGDSDIPKEDLQELEMMDRKTK